MAVDRKADYVGNHGGAYTDDSGMRRQFTIIDHDKKSKLPPPDKLTDEEKKSLRDSINAFTERSIKEILALPAVNILNNSQGLYEEFITRNVEKGVIEWNEEMVRNACRINDTLRYNMRNAIWRQTVKEQFWYDDMPHEDIMAGKWKELM